MSGAASKPGRAARRTTAIDTATGRLAVIGRYLVPLDDAPVLRFFLDELCIAHNRRERLQRSLLATTFPGVTARVLADGVVTPAYDATNRPRTPGRPSAVDAHGTVRFATRVVERAADLLRGTPLAEIVPRRWILLGEYPAAPRGRLLVFLFADRGDRPTVVLKARRLGDRRRGHRTGRWADDPKTGGRADGPAAGLRHEWQALERCRALAGLRGSIPEPIGLVADADLEVLALRCVPGRSAYVDLWRDLEPHRHVSRHLVAAAEWLASFHEATAEGDGVAAHGDFWAGNLLFDDDRGPVVVDWERYRPAASRLDDLFWFALTYALDMPGERLRRQPPEEVFRRAFLDDTPLAHHLGTYFRTYCRRTGIEVRRLDDALEQWLIQRADRLRSTAGEVSSAGEPAAPAHRHDPPAADDEEEEGIPWIRLQALMAGADRSVFSASSTR